MEKAILITGISGMLGSAVYRHLKSFGEYTIYGVSRKADFSLGGCTIIEGDLTSFDLYSELSQIHFDCIIHCSAEVNVNLCEENRVHAYQANFKATELLVSMANFKSFFYISTDSVFDGSQGNYLEDSEPNPLNYYALTKLMGEKSLTSKIGKIYIIRTNIYGFVHPLKKSLFEWAITELKGDNPIRGYSNMFFNPLYVSQVAQLLKLMIATEVVPGIYNLSSDDRISKYDFLVRIADIFGFYSKKIESIAFDPLESHVKRALNTTLNNNKIKRVFPEFNFTIDSGMQLLHREFYNLSTNEVN